MHEQRAPLGPLHQALAVVHPGVVAAQLAAPDELQPAVGGHCPGPEQPLPETGHVLDELRRRELDAPARREEPARQAGLERSEVDAMRRRLERPEREPALRTPAVGAEPQPEVEQPARSGQRQDQRPPGAPEPAQAAAPGEPGGEGVEDLPVVPRVGGRGEQRRRVLGRVAHRQEVEDDVVVVVLEGGGGRKDEVGVAGGLVDVEVHRRHEVERGQGSLEPGAVGRGENGVAGDGEQAGDAPRPGSEDLLRQGGHRVLAAELGKPADARPPATEVATAGQPTPQDVEGGPGEHRAPGAVEVSGDGVENVEQPLAEAAELLGGQPDPPVGHRPGSRGKAPGQAADALRRDAGGPGDALGRELAHHPLHLLEAVRETGQPARRHPAFREQRVQQRQEEERIAARTDEVVNVRQLGGLRAARVHHHQAAAAGPQRLEPERHPRRGHQAPVGHHRVRPEQEQEVGAVHVRDGKQKLVAEHEQRRQVMRELVDAGRE